MLEGTAHAQAIFPTDQGERRLRELIAFLLAPRTGAIARPRTGP